MQDGKVLIILSLRDGEIQEKQKDGSEDIKDVPRVDRQAISTNLGPSFEKETDQEMMQEETNTNSTEETEESSAFDEDY